MLRTNTLLALSSAALLLLPCAAIANEDLSSYQAVALDFPENDGSWPAANWTFEAGNTIAKQTLNSDPAFLLGGTQRGSFSATGTMGVADRNSDDDFIGFVFGYQNASNFFLFDWKNGTQSYWGVTGVEGMSLRKFSGVTGDPLLDHSLPAFMSNTVAVGGVSVLRTKTSPTMGWLEGRNYTFHIEADQEHDTVNIDISDGATSLWTVSLTGAGYAGGKFGLYNNSQENAIYSVSSIASVPEPTTSLMILIGLSYLALRTRLSVAPRSRTT